MLQVPDHFHHNSSRTSRRRLPGALKIVAILAVAVLGVLALASKAISDVAQGTIANTVSLAPSSAKAGPAYLYPNPSLTPGALLTTDASTICAPGYASRSGSLHRDEGTGVR